jgi:chloramphenicol 3-O-phosphotransferase
VNGSPSAGKTSLIRALLSRLEDPWFHHNLDRHLLGYHDRQRVGDEYWALAVAGYEACLVALLDSGQSVVSECVLPSGNPSRLMALLRPYNPFVIGLTCDLKEVHRRERVRQRHLGPYFVSVAEHAAIQAFRHTDLSLDSTLLTDEELATEAEVALLQSNFSGRGFAVP